MKKSKPETLKPMIARIPQPLFEAAKHRAVSEGLALRTLTAFALEAYLRTPSRFITACADCRFRKERQYYSDAKGWVRTHQSENPSHNAAVERRAEAKKEHN